MTLSTRNNNNNYTRIQLQQNAENGVQESLTADVKWCTLDQNEGEDTL